MRVLFVAPVYWPAAAFGGPISVMRELAVGLRSRGHDVAVLASSLRTLRGSRTLRTRSAVVDGVPVDYAATPARFRWMGITPTAPLLLRRAPRPDVVHVFGFRDPVGTVAAAWCRRAAVPYVFEGLGMYAPKLRKVRLKSALDATLYRHVPAHAALAVAASEREADEYRAGGIEAERIVVRPNGFPTPRATPPGRPGPLRERLGLDAAAPLVLSVGRVAAGKGLELLAAAAHRLPDVTVAVVGPDDGHGTTAVLRRTAPERFHLLGAVDADVLPRYYADADVFVLDSAHENFGLVTAEAAAAGTASVLSDRCGVSEWLRDRGAVVVPYGDPAALRDALARLLADADLRSRLGAAALEVAAELSWPHVVELQEEIYVRATRR
jgi:glycosyltransferase involved in cell wall biosynthesis